MSRRPRSVLRIGVGGALAGALGLVQAASGQDGAPEPRGLRVIVDYSLGLDVDTNRKLDDPSPGTYTALINGFGIAVLSNTRNQTFALNFGTDFRIENDPGQEDEGVQFEWNDPTFNVNYTREAANARFGAAGNFRQRDVDTLEPFFIDIDGDAIIDESGFEDSEGTLNEFGASVTLETGIDAPIGTAYTASYQSRVYNDTDDPSLYNRYEYRLATTTSLRFSELTVGRVNLSAGQYEYTEGRDLTGERASFSVGLSQQVSRTLSFDVSAGYSKVREDEIINGESVIDANQGPNFFAEVDREVDDGSYFAVYSRELVEEEFRNRLSFGRNLSMRNYDLRGSVGVTALDGGDAAPTFGLTYARALSDGRFTASVRRIVTVNTDDEERVLTSAIVGYDYEINELSSFNLGFDYALVSNVGDDQSDDDETRATLIASYRHALTREWDLLVGYRARSRSTSSEDAFSNAVFLNVGRRLILRP